jgi:hypothetical protein
MWATPAGSADAAPRVAVAAVVLAVLTPAAAVVTLDVVGSALFNIRTVGIKEPGCLTFTIIRILSLDLRT